mmetsp:Transcript_14918/g.47017  ORF Transcript_14918/g.47017 Transcript_14918/m.47017 type:complete len:221 (-) Transcript_14918:2038-2700(-)
MRAPPPSRMVSCPRRAAAWRLLCSAGKSKKTQVTSLADGAFRTSSISRRSSRVRWQRSTTTLALPSAARRPALAVASMHFFLPISSWLVLVQPASSRARAKVDLPEAGRPQSIRYLGIRLARPFFSCSCSLSSRLALAPRWAGRSTASAAAGAPESGPAASGPLHSCAAYSRTNFSCFSVSTLPGRMRRRCCRTSLDCIWHLTTAPWLSASMPARMPPRP